MGKTFFLFLFTLFASFSIYGQYTNVTIFTPGLSYDPEEPSIAINPKNTNYLVAGANLNYVSYTTNGGINWSTQYGLICTGWGVWGDPCIICDTNNIFYYFHLANPSSGQGNWIDRIICQKSTNNGVSFSNPGSYTGLNGIKAQDKEWAIVDPRTNTIYVTWTQFDEYDPQPPNQSDTSRILFSKSTDASATWSAPIRIDKVGGDCVDSDNTVEGAVPCVGPNGEIYVGWGGPKVRNTQWGIYFNKSTNGGVNWLSQPTYVCDQPGGWDYMIAGLQRCNGMPITCCDLSNSSYRGNIYICYSDSAGNLDHDIKLVKSTNGGNNWSTPLRVNNDAPGKEQFLPWMTIDQKTGYIYIVFYDRRNYTNNATDVYLAKSTDGGNTFSNFVISASSFVPSSGTFFGDYTNITAHNGHVRPIWARLQGTQLSVLTAIIDFTTGETNNSTTLPSEYKLEQNYPNPFNPTTTINYSIKENTFVSLKVYNLIGQEIATLINGERPAGNYSITFDSKEYSIPSGVYFYKLIAGNYTNTKKMIVTK